MPQAKGVAHLVHGDELQALGDELVFLLLGEPPAGAHRQRGGGQRGLAGMAVEELAAAGGIAEAGAA